MPGKKKNKTAADRVKRISFPGDEKSRSWLTLLLDGYHIVDRGIAGTIESEKKNGRTLACSRGCSHCCSTHKDIPVYPLEIIGITWYVTEKIRGDERAALKKQLQSFHSRGPCPFIIEGVCSIHPVRPMACRQFNVFGRACEEGEDPYYTRREDVMDPVKKHVDQAFYLMLPYYGVEKETERIRIIETGSFHRMAKELHGCNWRGLAEKMERQDKEQNNKRAREQ